MNGRIRVADLLDDNLVLQMDVDVRLALDFSIEACSFEAGDKAVLFSPQSEDVLVCDSAIIVFLSLMEKRHPFSVALSALTVVDVGYAKRLLRELERMNIIRLVAVH